MCPTMVPILCEGFAMGNLLFWIARIAALALVIVLGVVAWGLLWAITLLAARARENRAD